MTNLMTAALPTTATVAPPTDLDLLPDGLTDVDTARIRSAIAAARTESTRRLYALAWAQTLVHRAGDGGALTDWVSWRAAFLVNVPIAVAMIVGARAVLTETPRRGGRFDAVGALCATLGMGALVFGIIESAESGWASLPVVVALVLWRASPARGAGRARRTCRTAHHAVETVQEPGTQRRLCRPHALPRCDDRLLLLHHPADAGRTRLHPAPGWPRVPADDRGELRK